MTILKNQIVELLGINKNIYGVSRRGESDFGVVRHNGWELGVFRPNGLSVWRMISAFKPFVEFPRYRDLIRREVEKTTRSVFQLSPAKKVSKPKMKSTWVAVFNNSTEANNG